MVSKNTLHLTEIYDLFASGHSDLDLDKDKLKEYHKNLGFVSVKWEADYLEFIKATTKDGIEIKIIN